MAKAKDKKEQELKKGFKMPSAFTILLGLGVFVVLLSWFVPGGEFVDAAGGGKEFVDKGVNPLGLLNAFSSVYSGFADAKDLIFFIFCIGGFLGIVLKTGALEAAVGALLKKLNGKEKLLIPILMSVFALGGTTYGMAEETIPFYIIIIPVFIFAGYDALTGLYVVLVGAGLGVLGSTINPFAIGAAVDAAGVTGVGVGSGIIFRFITWAIFVVVGIWWVMRYGAKVKANAKDSKVADLHNEHVANAKKIFDPENIPAFTGKRKVTMFLFGLTFLLMIMSVIPWTSFKITFFDDIANTLGGGAGAYLSTGIPGFGNWWFGELAFLFLLMAIVLGILSGLKEKEIVNSFIDGAADLLSVALVIGVARSISVLLTTSGMDATILNGAQEMLSGMPAALFSVLTYIIYIPLSFLVPSTSGLAGATFGVMGPLADGIGDGLAPVAITGFSYASGIVNLITPTSGVVIGAIAIAKIPYERYVKAVFPLLGIVFAMSIVFMILHTFMIF